MNYQINVLVSGLVSAWITLVLFKGIHCFQEKDVKEAVQKWRSEYEQTWNAGDMNNLDKFYTSSQAEIRVEMDDWPFSASGRQEIKELFAKYKLLQADVIKLEVESALQLSETRIMSIEKIAMSSAIHPPQTGSGMILWNNTEVVHGSGDVTWIEQNWLIEKHIFTIPLKSPPTP